MGMVDELNMSGTRGLRVRPDTSLWFETHWIFVQRKYP